MNISTKFRKYQAATGRTIYYRTDFPSRTAGRLGSLLTWKVTHSETRTSAPFPIARGKSSHHLSMLTTGANFSRSGGLFSCRHTGQDSSGKKSNQLFIPAVGFQIPIRKADVFNTITLSLHLFSCLAHVQKPNRMERQGVVKA